MAYKHIIWHRSPECVWYQTPDGWSTRAWKSGERAEYCRNVLNREPFSGEN